MAHGLGVLHVLLHVQPKSRDQLKANLGADSATHRHTHPRDWNENRRVFLKNYERFLSLFILLLDLVSDTKQSEMMSRVGGGF